MAIWMTWAWGGGASVDGGCVDIGVSGRERTMTVGAHRGQCSRWAGRGRKQTHYRWAAPFDPSTLNPTRTHDPHFPPNVMFTPANTWNFGYNPSWATVHCGS